MGTSPASPASPLDHQGASSPLLKRSIKVSRASRADRVEVVLRRADVAFEKWLRRARKQSAGVLRHRVDDLQAGLKKLSAGLEQLERDHKLTLPIKQTEREPAAAPSKRRARPTARKATSPGKRKKAA
jgi:hypothetical protein